MQFASFFSKDLKIFKSCNMMLIISNDLTISKLHDSLYLNTESI